MTPSPRSLEHRANGSSPWPGSILSDSEAAADALQEALILAWRDIRALREPDAWEAWSTRLTVRACYRLAKQERRRTQPPAHGRRR